MKISFQNTYYPKYTCTYTNTTLSKNDTVNSYAKNSYQISFASTQSSITPLYFVRMSTYKKNLFWNAKMCKATKIISKMMQNGVNIERIIQMTEHFVNRINRTGDKSMFGIRKYLFGSCIDLRNDSETRGYEYLSRYRKYFGKCTDTKIHTPKSNSDYPLAITCKIIVTPSSITIRTGKNNPANIQTNMDLVERAYNALQKKKLPTRKEIVDTAATIQWLIAQETPYLRGSDSVANLLTRSLLDSYGIELFPLKKGVSCDYEAFYRNLDDYIEIYPTLFEKNLLN